MRRREDAESHSRVNGIWVSLNFLIVPVSPEGQKYFIYPSLMSQGDSAETSISVLPACLTLLIHYKDRIAQTAVEAEEEEDDE